MGRDIDAVHAGDPPSLRWYHYLQGLWLRLAASGCISPRRYLPKLPDVNRVPETQRTLRLEIVSHCWQYAHLLAYQLSSLVLHPPTKLAVRMTVFFAPEDKGTTNLLRFFGPQRVPNVTWNWRALERRRLFRRAIGRNLAARETTADWIWFTDCDVVFQAGCLDALSNELSGRRDRLVYPKQEYCTALLDRNHPVLRAGARGPRLVTLPSGLCRPVDHDRAVGPLQIVPRDVAQAVGYCDCLRYYQRPAKYWQKAYEDRAFRWLLRTNGTPINVPGVCRIKHLDKGRYHNDRWTAAVRRAIRQRQSRHASPAPA